MLFRGEEVPFTGLTTDISSFKPFQAWLAKFPAEWTLHSLELQSVDFFGPRIGFIKFKADITNNDTGKKLPGIVFMRGGAVAVLVVLECEGEQHALVCRQPRVPIATNWFCEIPAGMLDDEEHFAGVAAKEMEEETGIVLSASDLVDLTGLVYGDREGLYPSGGGCDEFCRIFYTVRTVSKDEMDAMVGRMHGEGDHETIRLDVVPLDKLAEAAPDMKALSALALLDVCKRTGKI